MAAQYAAVTLLVSDRWGREGRGAHGGVRAGVEHDEVVAETVHLLEGNTSVQN